MRTGPATDWPSNSNGFPGAVVMFANAAVDLHETVLVELQEVQAHAPIHIGKRAVRQRDLRAGKFADLHAMLGCCGS